MTKTLNLNALGVKTLISDISKRFTIADIKIYQTRAKVDEFKRCLAELSTHQNSQEIEQNDNE